MDTRLALGINPIQIPDQAASLQRAMTLRALMGQTDLQDLQLQQGKLNAEEELATREAVKQSGGDFGAAAKFLLQGGHYKAANSLQKSYNETMKAGLDTQETQGKITKQQSDQAQGLAAGFMSLSDQQKQQGWPQFAAEWKRRGLPNADQMPPQLTPDLIPRLTMIANSGLTSEQAATRGDYAQLGGDTPTATVAAPASPTLTALTGGGSNVAAGGVGAGTQAYNDRFTPEQTTIGPGTATTVPPASPAPNPAVAALTAPDLAHTTAAQENAAWNAPAQMTAPTETVTAKPPMQTPDELRAKAAAARAKGTKPGFDAAKDYETAANQLEQRILQEQGLEQQKKQGEEAIRVREEGIKVRQANQANQGKTNAGKLADDFRQEPAVKSYRTVQPVYASMQEAATKNTAASDLNLVYGISKLFDPESVVREGEQIMVVNAGGLPSKIQAWIGSVNGGQKLSDTLRTEIMAEAGSRVGALKQAHDAVVNSYTDQAKRWEIDPNDVVRKYEITPASGKGKGPRGAGSGTQNDPFKIKGDDGFNAIKSGEFFTGPDGKLRQKP